MDVVGDAAGGEGIGSICIVRLPDLSSKGEIMRQEMDGAAKVVDA